MREFVKCFRTCFKQNDRIHLFDVPIAERLFLLVADTFVLPEEQVGGVAGTALTGKLVPDLLRFDVCQASVFQFDQNVHDEQGDFHRYSSTRSAHLLRRPYENVMMRKHMAHREAILMAICCYSSASAEL